MIFCFLAGCEGKQNKSRGGLRSASWKQSARNARVSLSERVTVCAGSLFIQAAEHARQLRTQTGTLTGVLRAQSLHYGTGLTRNYAQYPQFVIRAELERGLFY